MLNIWVLLYPLMHASYRVYTLACVSCDEPWIWVLYLSLSKCDERCILYACMYSVEVHICKLHWQYAVEIEHPNCMDSMDGVCQLHADWCALPCLKNMQVHADCMKSLQVHADCMKGESGEIGRPGWPGRPGRRGHKVGQHKKVFVKLNAEPIREN